MEFYWQLEHKMEANKAKIEAERARIGARRTEEQKTREELITLKAELEARLSAKLKESYGLLALCCRPVIVETSDIDAEARKERRAALQTFVKEAFEGAENDDRELTLEDLREIEGDNAETVMREADVNGDGVLSKREYVSYKIFIAKQASKMARRAYKAADVNNIKEITLEELKAIEGPNAEKVMREADVDGNGSLSKREYVDYKIRCATHTSLQKR